MSGLMAILAFSLSPLFVGIMLGNVKVGLGFSTLIFLYLSFRTGETILLGISVLILIFLAITTGQKITTVILGDYYAQ